MTVTCIILAGGLGTRLRSVLGTVPKCLAPVAGAPFLSWQMRSLAARGIDRFVLSLGVGAAQVVESLATWGARWRIDCVTEPQPLGTGGAIRYAMQAARLDEALVANGDTFLGGDLGAMLAPLNQHGGERVRLATAEVPDRRRYGGLAVAPDGKVTHFIEKGQGGAGPINAGLYRVHINALEDCHDEAFSLESVVLPALAQQGALWATAVAGPFIDIGMPEDYRAFVEQLDHFMPGVQPQPGALASGEPGPPP